MLFHDQGPNSDYTIEELSDAFAAMVVAVERTSVMAVRAREINLAAQRALVIVQSS